MSFPRYPKYKPSGVEWLGDVPEHWDVVPCRGIVRERTAKNDDGSCEDYLSLMANVGIIPYAEKGDVGNKKPEDLSKCKLVKKGDFVINSMNYGIGSYGVSAYDGVCSPVYIVMTPQQEIVQPRFAFRIFEDRAFQTYAQSFGNGIPEHRCAINWDILKVMGVAVPPRDEQQTLLGFLDRETSKIDGLVAEQRRLIELLKEKRQAVISHAVTKGLNPHAPLKPSAIQWLGDVPEHWEIGRLDRLVSTRKGVAFKADDFSDDGVVVVRATDVKNLTVKRSDVRLPPAFRSQYPKAILETEEIVLTTVGSTPEVRASAVGQVGKVPRDLAGSLLNQNTVVFTPSSCSLRNGFLFLVIQTSGYRDHLDLHAHGTANQASLNVSDMIHFSLPLPDPNEQTAIVDFIDAETAKLDALTAEAERAIKLMQERRTALISAAVTGKIDVREFSRGVAGNAEKTR